MKPDVPQELLDQAKEWNELHRWERRELGKALRRLGLTYSEIREIIPVPKGTLSNWCHSLVLTEDQIQAIRARMPSQKGVPKDSQWRRRIAIKRIREEAAQYATEHCDDAFFVAGVVLYWAEGSKWRNDFAVANTDPAVLRLFVSWVRTHLSDQADSVSASTCTTGTTSDSRRPTGGLNSVCRTPTSPRHTSSHRGRGIGRIACLPECAGCGFSDRQTTGNGQWRGSKRWVTAWVQTLLHSLRVASSIWQST